MGLAQRGCFALITLCVGLTRAADPCTDVTKPIYSADPTGATDSSAAFNAAIVAAGSGDIPPIILVNLFDMIYLDQPRGSAWDLLWVKS